MAGKVVMYTDGACKGNPGPGGWGVVLRYGDACKTLHGGERQTTNNRMELMAAIRGLRALTRACEVELYTDSQYVRKGITEWMAGWKAKNWPSKIKNQDLWKRIDALVNGDSGHKVTFHWVKGHSGHPENERADQLAVNAIPRG